MFEETLEKHSGERSSVKMNSMWLCIHSGKKSEDMVYKLLLLIIIDAAALPEKGSALVLHTFSVRFQTKSGHVLLSVVESSQADVSRHYVIGC